MYTLFCLVFRTKCPICMFTKCIHAFKEGAKIGDCFDPVDHAVLLDKFTEIYTLRQKMSLFSDKEPIYS